MKVLPAIGDGGGNVRARRLIPQSPLTEAPDVPSGARGHIDDYDDPYILVDFGDPYGVVICDPSELI